MASPNHIWAGLSSVAELAKSSDIPKVVDNLTSVSSSDALSARQGKTLKDALDSLSSSNNPFKIKVATGMIPTGSAEATLDLGVTIGVIIYSVNIRITNPRYFNTPYGTISASGTFIGANKEVFPEADALYNSWSVRDAE